ncbi:MAG: hypothetical protein DDT21_02657 [Syntrophomonadaceae bacterium]|nr:hypothetical protein [Bacillota bacterium]
MVLYEKLDARFRELLEEGNKILNKYGWNGKDWEKSHIFPSLLEYNKWYTSAKNLIEKICGENSSYNRQFENLYADKKGNPYYFFGFLGILQASYDDWKLGLLEDTKSLITAEVFSNFIEQAEYLLEEGYKLPSAVIVRAVLEDGLRTLCKKNEITLPERPKLDWMNSELVKKSVYNKNVQKQVTAWAGIGNSAAHMEIDGLTDAEVKNMINGVISFNATYLK